MKALNLKGLRFRVQAWVLLDFLSCSECSAVFSFLLVSWVFYTMSFYPGL